MGIFLAILGIAVFIVVVLLFLDIANKFKEKYERSAFHWQHIVLFAICFLLMLNDLNVLSIILLIVGTVLLVIYFAPRYGTGYAIFLPIYNLIGAIVIIYAVVKIYQLIKSASEKVNK